MEDDKMKERRQSTREPTYLHGVIYFNHGRDSLSCVIRDFSYEGARIVIFDPIDISDEVELHIPEKKPANARHRAMATR
jgi:PilZ domain